MMMVRWCCGVVWCDGILENYENRMPAWPGGPVIPGHSKLWSEEELVIYYVVVRPYHCSPPDNRSLSVSRLVRSVCKLSFNQEVLNRSKLSSLRLYLHTERL